MDDLLYCDKVENRVFWCNFPYGKTRYRVYFPIQERKRYPHPISKGIYIDYQVQVLCDTTKRDDHSFPMFYGDWLYIAFPYASFMTALQLFPAHVRSKAKSLKVGLIIEFSRVSIRKLKIHDIEVGTQENILSYMADHQEPDIVKEEEVKDDVILSDDGIF